LHETYVETNSVSESFEPSVELNYNPFAINIVEGMSVEEVQAAAEEIDRVIGPILIAEGNTLVRCDRLGGAVMTLSEAVMAIWPPSITGAMIIEGIPSVLAEIQKMLATQPAEAKEPEEEIESEFAQTENNSEVLEDEAGEIEEKDNLKSEETLKPEATSKKDDRQEISKESPDQKIPKEGQSTKEAGQTSRSEAPARTVDNTPEPGKDADTLTSTASPETQKNESKRSGEAKPQSETGARTAKAPREMDDTDHANAFEVSKLVSKPEDNKVRPESSSSQTLNINTSDSVKLENQLETVLEKPVSIFESSRLNEIESTIPEVGLPPNQLEHAEVQEIVVNLAHDVDVKERSEVVQEGEGMDLAALAQEVGAVGIAGFTEIVPVLEKIELLDLREGEESGPLLKVEGPTIDSEQVVLTSVPAVEVEEIIAQLIDRIEPNDSEALGGINGTLNEIVEVATKLEVVIDEKNIEEIQAPEELEELLIKLLDGIGIEYTPEMIEPMARLVVGRNMLKKIRKIKVEENEEPQDTGTHEAIMQLLLGISTVKKTKEHFYAIGKSALRLAVGSVA
jgi:outer membrane biosynthesis protein TonB